MGAIKPPVQRNGAGELERFGKSKVVSPVPSPRKVGSYPIRCCWDKDCPAKVDTGAACEGRRPSESARGLSKLANDTYGFPGMDI